MKFGRSVSGSTCSRALGKIDLRILRCLAAAKTYKMGTTRKVLRFIELLSEEAEFCL